MSAIDYTKFGDGKAPDDRRADGQRRWWLCEEREAADAITATLASLEKQQSERLRQLGVSARLYGNVSSHGPGGITARATTEQKERATYNVIQICVDSAVARHAKSRPRPLFLTSGGDYKAQRRAKRLNKFVEGIFYENSAHAIGLEAMRDAAVTGDGLVHVFARHGRVTLERLLASELWVDEQEAVYGRPRQAHRRKSVDREVLADGFPEKRAAITDAPAAKTDVAGSTLTTSDLVEVRESWHLPSGPDARDGWRMISIEGHILEAEQWTHDFFPFARLPWCPRMWGYWSQGLAEQLQGVQYAINKTLWLTSRTEHLAGSLKILMPRGSKIVKEHLSNEVGAIIEYDGTPPQYVTTPGVPAEMYQRVDRLDASAHKQAGLSQLSTSAQKPAGLNSGKALREYSDIESERLALIGKAYETFFLDLARLSLAVVKDLAGQRGSYMVRSPSGRTVTTLTWADVDLDESQYVMQCYPVSSLPRDPAGRLQTVQEYMQAGLLTPRQGKRLLDFPDLEQVDSLATAAEEYLEQILDRIVDEGEYTPPEPFDDLGLAREMALLYYALGKGQGLEEERLELLRRFVLQVDALQQQAAPTPEAMPQAAPAAPPTSDMIQNVPGMA
jgi:hypothetical protein